MQRRNLIALIAAAIVVVGIAALVATRGDRAVSVAATGQRALPGLADKVGDVAHLRVMRGTMTVNLAAADGHWTVVEKSHYPADEDRIRKLLLQLAQLELVEPKTGRPELLARLDLDDPANGKSTEITAQDRNGAVLGQIVIGRARPSEIGQGEAGVYVRMRGNEQAWLARGTFELGGDVLSWLDRHIIDIRPGRIASVVLSAPDGDAVILSRGSADQPFTLDSVPQDAKAKNDAALAMPAGALEGLTLEDVKPASGPPDAAKGGTTAAFSTFDGLVVGLWLSPPDSGDWLAISATGTGKAEAEAQALDAKLSHWRFAIPAARAKLLRTTLSDLLQRGS